MDYGIYRDLLFFIVPQHGAIVEATGWDINSTPEAPSNSALLDPYNQYPTFHEQYELDVVLAVFEALTEITAESRELKLSGCRERIKSSPSLLSGHIPLEISPLEHKFWARKSIWHPDEAALLSLGFIPTQKVISALQKLDARSFLVCPLLKEFRERADLIVEANRSGQLGSDGDPSDLLEWFKRLEFELPDGLEKTVLRFHGLETSQPQSVARENQYNDREKDTLLKLVAGMAVRGYSFDPKSSRNAATKDIQSDLDFLGIGLDQKTILKWLREAIALLPDEKKN